MKSQTREYVLKAAALALLLPAGLTAPAGNYGGLEASAFMLHVSDPIRQRDAFTERITAGPSFRFACHRSAWITRHHSIRYGISFSMLNFMLETQGVFPETGSYGFLGAYGESQFWGMNLSLLQHLRTRGSFGYALRVEYEASRETYTRTRLEAAGGADQSAYHLQYRNDIERFHHRFRLSFVNRISAGNGAVLEFSPWMSAGNGYYRSGSGRGLDLAYGVEVSFCFRLPRISIEWTRTCDNRAEREKLKKKQKEIEEKLKNKPK